MDQDEAIRRASVEAKRLGAAITQEPPRAIYKSRHMCLGKNRSGWLVVFRLRVPNGFEPNDLDVEVYEPDGEVYVPPIL